MKRKKENIDEERGNKLQTLREVFDWRKQFIPPGIGALGMVGGGGDIYLIFLGSRMYF